MIIRSATQADYPAIHQLVEAAFREEAYSDQREHLLVNRLRHASAYVPELELVVEKQGELVGHILLTRVFIRHQEEAFPALALAPVSVLPAYQRQGIGGALIEAAHIRARALGYSSIVLVGHADYYPRFGYKPAHRFGISVPFEVPPENCMVLALIPDGLKGVNGMVQYDPAFFQ